jgi:ABC-2 type transport system ATP-binding protein
VTLETAEAAALSRRIAETFRLPAVVVNGSVRVEAPRGHEFLRDAVEAMGDSIRSASFGRPNLEDVFVQLTGRRLSEEGTPPVETGAGGRSGGHA